MIRFQTHFKLMMLAVVLAVLLVGCIGQAPILVFITPTPDMPTEMPIDTPTLEPLPSDIPEETIEVNGNPVIIGPVVDNNYTLEPATNGEGIDPTNPPRPTVPPRRTPVPRTPTVAPPTNTPEPTPTPTVSATPVPKLNRDLMGIQVDANKSTADWDMFLSRAKELGVGWLKVQANWSFLQPNGHNADEQRLRTFELNIQSADRAGFKILLSVAKAPHWTRANLQGGDAPPDNPQDLAEFLNVMFYNTKIGEVIDAVEVWNEPNLRREWNTAALPFSGAGYMQLFAPSYNAIRAYRGDLAIVSAGLAPTSTIGDASIDDRVYLQQMYNAGLANYADIAVGIHPYGWGNPPDARCCGDPNSEPGWDDNPHFFFLDNIEATREIMNANGHSNVQMWGTEFGWAVWEDTGVPLPDPPENNLWMNYTTLDEQVDYTIRAFEIAQQRGDIGVMILWNLNFANELSIQNREEVIAYSLTFPDPNGANGLRRRPLYYILPFTTAP